MTLITTYSKILKKYADKQAVEFNEETKTFSELDKESNQIAHALQAAGVEKGDRVALFLGTCMQTINLFLAILKAGGIIVPINTSFKGTEATHLLKDSGAKVVVTDNTCYEVVKEIKNNLPGLKKIITVNSEYETSYADFIKDQPHEPLDIEITDEDGSIIFYTSGTTGQPKGALLSHKNMVADLEALKMAWHMDESDKLLLALPLHHIHGVGVALASCFYNGFEIILRKKYNPEETPSLLKEKNCTLFMGVPAMYVKMLEVKDTPDLSNMRLFISGSAPLSAETFKEFEDRFGFKILERAGMSETNMNFSNSYEGKRKPGTVGLPLQGVQARIVDKDFNDVQVGEEGSILLKGDNVFKGYWNDEEKTKESFHDGWFITGDLGKVDEDGYYMFLGRSKDLIISGGINIYPTEVEEVINSHPAVHESALIGIPDKTFGESVKAYVVKKPGQEVTGEEIINFCKENLASFKKPKIVEFIDALPRNSMGKVQKTVLREQNTDTL